MKVHLSVPILHHIRAHSFLSPGQAQCWQEGQRWPKVGYGHGAGSAESGPDCKRNRWKNLPFLSFQLKPKVCYPSCWEKRGWSSASIKEHSLHFDHLSLLRSWLTHWLTRHDNHITETDLAEHLQCHHLQVSENSLNTDSFLQGCGSLKQRISQQP